LSIRNEAIEKYKNTIDAQRRSIAEREEKIGFLSTKLTEDIGIAADLRRSLELKLRELEEERVQSIETKDATIASLRDELFERDALLVSLREEIASRDNATVSLRDEISNRDDVISALRLDMNKSNELVTSLSAENSQQQQAIEACEKSLNVKQEELAYLEQSVDEYIGELENLRAHVDDLEEANGALVSQRDAVKEQLIGERAVISGLRSELKEVEVQFKEEQRQSLEHIAARDDANKKLRSSLKQANEVREQLEGDKRRLESYKEEFEKNQEKTKGLRVDQLRGISEKLVQARQLLN